MHIRDYPGPHTVRLLHRPPSEPRRNGFNMRLLAQASKTRQQSAGATRMW
jgi:hypothetical protein